MSAKQRQDRVMSPERAQRINGNAFEFPFNLANRQWSFNTSIMARTQNLYTSGGLEKGFRRFFADRLNHAYSFSCGVGYISRRC